ncbi:hypothetical protein B488_02480 [Liberibacter crescens BT-1]|uniref:Uncharacterized protein n=1 Tax=Liberibacter crescens (strain BT-1) TaxID=1215343 RepID=L0EV20_LIBCB|nr:hypothetical protein B488_02480 [Liberibacter crescens BT-1]
MIIDLSGLTVAEISKRAFKGMTSSYPFQKYHLYVKRFLKNKNLFSTSLGDSLVKIQ